MHANRQVPRKWIERERDWEWEVPYHEYLAPDAKKLRHAVAEWAAKEIFGIEKKRFLEACRSLEDGEDVSDLGAPNFGRLVTYDSFEECVQFQKEWDELEAYEKTEWVLFGLYWLWQTNDELKENEEWKSLCQRFGFENGLDCLYVDFDPHYPVCVSIESGLAPFAVKQLYGITMVLAVEEEEQDLRVPSLNTLQEGDLEFPEYCFLFHNGHLHYEPVLWLPVVVEEISERNFSTERSMESKSSKEPVKKATRHVDTTIRGSWLVGLGVWNVNHLSGVDRGKLDEVPVLKRSERLSKKEKVEYKGMEVEEAPTRGRAKSKSDKDGAHRGASDDYKNTKKIEAVANLVKNNRDWLDVLALNEVNQGVDRLSHIPGAKMYKGPHLMSVGPSRTIGQHEYYPLLVVERERDFTIAHHSCFAVDHEGRVDRGDEILWMKAKHKKTLENELGKAEKRKSTKKVKQQVKLPMTVEVTIKKTDTRQVRWQALPTCRPVVVHRLKVDTGASQPIWLNVGIVHTTPGGTEFERFEVYTQLETFFQMAAEKTYDEKGGLNLWIVAGDYYLLGESLVKTLEDVPNDEETAKAFGELKKDLILGLKEMRKTAKQAMLEFENLPEELRKHGEGLKAPEQEVKKKNTKRKATTEEDNVLAVKKLAKSHRKGAESSLEQLEEIAGAIEEKLKELDESDSEGSVNLKELQKECNQLNSFHERCASDLPGHWNLLDDSADWLRVQKEGGEKKVRDGGVTLEVEVQPKKDEDDEKDEFVSAERFFLRNKGLSKTVRHRLRNLAGTTFEGQVKPLFHVIQTIWGTNLHGEANLQGGKEGIEYTYFRLADFVVCSKEFRTCEVGLFLEDGKLTRVDDDKVSTCLYWRTLSDHFPVGGRFSLRENDIAAKRIFVDEDDKTKLQARMLMYLLDFEEGVHNQRKKRQGEERELLQSAFRSRDYGKAFAVLKESALRDVPKGLFGEELDWLAKVELSDDPEAVQAVLREMSKRLRAYNMMALHKEEAKKKEVKELEFF